MSRSLGPEQPSGAAETESAFREQLRRTIARWQEHLGALGPSPQWGAAIASEAAAMEAVAQSRGWAVARHLAYLGNIAHNARPSLPGALCSVVEALRLEHGAESPHGSHLDAQSLQGAGAPVTNWPPPVVSPPLLASSLAASPSEAWRVAPPPLITASEALLPHRSTPADATLRSNKLGGGADRSEPPLAAAVPASPGPSPVLHSDSLRRPRASPSLLFKSVLGLRAFRRKDVPRDLPGARKEPERGGGLLGFRGLASDAGRRVMNRPHWAPQAGSRPEHEARARWGDGPAGPPQPAKGSSASSRRQGLASKAEASAQRWFYVLASLVCLIGVATVCTAIVLARRPVGTSKGGLDGETPKKAVPTGPTAISSRTAPSFDVHQRGVETPELRRLLDEQAKLASRCTADPVSCPRGGWASFARDSQTPPEIKEFARSPSNVLLGAWLKPLKIPVELPVRDEQSLRASFEYNAKNRVGKADFQAKLFKCSAYSEIFESALIKYGAPTWLPAVVYRESGCDPGATSAVGAKGLWQFMPESARAYGLRVVEGDVDERLNPIKSTDAAIHFLMDLQHKLGAWDLALAGYNMGPYAVVAILAQIGQAADFWDLVHARALPEETASYVPAIQAYALILNNLSWLQFSRDGHRLESTAEIVVKPGMRLSLIARTAATTTRHIRELNPEFLRDVVPEGEGTARVPDAEAHRAQELLDEWMPDDRRDTCVPEDFDWGANQFERSRYAKNCPENAATR